MGAPWLGNQKLFDQLIKIKNPLDDFEVTQFTPRSIPGAKYPKYEGEICLGLRIKNLENPLEWTIQLLAAVKFIHPKQFRFLESNFIDKLYGSDRLRLSIEENGDIKQIIENFRNNEEEFLDQREKYLLY